MASLGMTLPSAQPAPPRAAAQNALEEILQRITAVVEQGALLADRLHRVNARAFGSQGEETAQQPKEVPNGMLRAISAQLESAETFVAMIRDEVDRLDKLA